MVDKIDYEIVIRVDERRFVRIYHTNFRYHPTLNDVIREFQRQMGLFTRELSREIRYYDEKQR